MRRRWSLVLLGLSMSLGGLALAGTTAPDESARAEAILAEQVGAWEQAAAAGRVPAELDAMRSINAEWDFMARTFLVLSLANRAIEEPLLEERYLAVMDAMIEDTLRAERELGQEHFLMPYGRVGGWTQGGRSVFVDGEIALMLTARRVVSPDRWGEHARARVVVVEAQLERGLAESYPDEGWLFCHSMAIAALRLHDHVEGSDHAELARGWVEMAKRELVDADTGLLVSAFRMDGAHLDGPEGSSIWLAATNLALVDPDFADQQYALAREELGASLMGLGYAREWPASWQGHTDVDSGPIVPGIQASASSSGFALLASRAFGDERWHRQLVRALDAADAIMAQDPHLAAMADNAVGEAVILYAFSFGPLWEEVGPYS
jgi:hypothetical protein